MIEGRIFADTWIVAEEMHYANGNIEVKAIQECASEYQAGELIGLWQRDTPDTLHVLHVPADQTIEEICEQFAEQLRRKELMKQYAVWNIQRDAQSYYPDCLATTYERRYAEQFVEMLNNSGRSYELQIQEFRTDDELNAFYETFFHDETPETEEEEAGNVF